MDELPFVSVVIPVFNDQHGIDTCLAALSQQDYPSWKFEVIVVDNASAIPTIIQQRFAHWAKVVRCGSPGSYAARNAGVAASRGEVLAFTDADCSPDRKWISAGVAALVRQPKCIVGGEVAVSLPERATVVALYQHLVGFMQRENIEQLGFSVTANLIMFTSDFESIGPFEYRLLSGGDREWSGRARRAGYELKYVPDSVVWTPPRDSLVAAIRQARRVAGGRYAMRKAEKSGSALGGSVRPHRNLLKAAAWILFHPQLTPWQRAQVFVVATILKTVHVLESARLALGAKPERR